MGARCAALAGIAALATSTAGSAAHADYYPKIDTLDGEAPVSDQSFGACNAGQCTTISSPRDASSGQSVGKVTASQNTRSLRESPTRTSSGKASWDLATGKVVGIAGCVIVAAGDADGACLAGLAYAATQSEVSNFTLTSQKIDATWRQVRAAKHIAKATLRKTAVSQELTNVTVSCASGAGGAG